MPATLSVPELAEILMAAGHHHHQAYISSDGVDPEWAMWYSSYLQAQIWDRAGEIPTRSTLVHLLIEADKNFEPTEEHPDWPPVYARYMLEELSR